MISSIICGILKGEKNVLELCTLGTGGTLPLPDRALSSLYVRQNGRAMLIDCGEGTQVGIRKLGWGFRCIEDVLLTHYHGDHCTGLAGLLLSLEKAGKTEALRIWGPKGLKRVVEGLCVIVPPLSYPVLLHELPPEGEELEAIGLQIRAFPVDHGGIPCYGYRMTLPRKNVFSPEKAKALGVAVTEWKKLQEGETVRAAGRKIRPEEVFGAPRKGITVVFSRLRSKRMASPIARNTVARPPAKPPNTSVYLPSSGSLRPKTITAAAASDAPEDTPSV